MKLRLIEMEQEKISNKTKINYWVNFVSLIPFILLILSGFIIQMNYHTGRKPDYYEVFTLCRYEWLLLHKTFALISTPIIVLHLFMHFNWIKNLLKKRSNPKSNKIAKTTRILLILYILTISTAIIPWLLIQNKHAEKMIIEIHDKLGLIIIIFFTMHFIQHFNWFKLQTIKIISNMKRSQHLKLSHLKTKFIHLNNRNCQACWKCVEKCPQKVIGRINLPFHKHTRLDYPEKCTGCLRCMKICEHDAIQRIVTI